MKRNLKATASITAIVMSLSCACKPLHGVAAAGTPTAPPEEITETLFSNSATDSSELLYNYMLTHSGVTPKNEEAKNGIGVFYKSGISAGSNLQGNNAAAYVYLKTQIQAIAAGTRTNTEIQIPFSEIGIKAGPWSAEELGVDEIVTGGSINSDAVNCLKEISAIDFHAVLVALLADFPYEMYWCDKTSYSYNAGNSMQARYENGAYQLYLTGTPMLKLYVSTDYSENGAAKTTSLPDGRLAAVSTAINNAQAIVDVTGNLRGIELLDVYRSAICYLTEYNFSAAGGGAPYGDPWQLIYVFDGDSSTNVVCEGYAKAFKYLCDLSGDRLKNISCLIASGYMGTDGNTGNHMWNVVNMDDNRSYLVDITQCDAISREIQEYTDTFFLNTPASGSYDTSYNFTFPGASYQEGGYIYSYPAQTYIYSYNSDTLANYQTKYLTLSTEAYTPVSSEITVEFVDINGIKDVVTVENIENLVLLHPYLDGYDFEGWKINNVLYSSEEAAKSAIEASSDETVTVRLIYAKKPQYYRVNVVNGKLSNGKTTGTAQVSQIVTVTANEAAAWKKFSHWLRNGVKVSINESYSFRMPSKNISLRAVFVDDTEIVEKSGTAIIESVTPNAANNKVSFVSVLNVPKNCTFVKGGLVATSDGSIGEAVTAENAAFVKLSTKATVNTKNLKYTWTKSNVTEDTIWYVKAYLVYQDNGVEKTVYSDCVKANIHGKI